MLSFIMPGPRFRAALADAMLFRGQPNDPGRHEICLRHHDDTFLLEATDSYTMIRRELDLVTDVRLEGTDQVLLHPTACDALMSFTRPLTRAGEVAVTATPDEIGITTHHNGHAEHLSVELHDAEFLNTDRVWDQATNRPATAATVGLNAKLLARLPRLSETKRRSANLVVVTCTGDLTPILIDAGPHTSIIQMPVRRT